MTRRLYRNEGRGMVGGVCSGLGDYLSIDPTWIRLFFVVLTLISGVGFVIYIAMWIMVPQGEADEETAQSPGSDRRGNVVIGAALLGLGLLFLIQNLDINLFGRFNFGALWPLLLIAIGGISVWRAANES